MQCTSWVRQPHANSNSLAQAEFQTLFGERLLEKPERLARQRPLPGLRVGIGRHEYAADAQALADLVSSLDPIARSIESNVHEHHIWTFPFGKMNGLIRRDGDTDDHMTKLLQQLLGVKRNEELILDNQDTQRPRLQVRLIALLSGPIATAFG